MNNSTMTYVNNIKVNVSTLDKLSGIVVQSEIMSDGSVVCLTDLNELMVRSVGIEKIIMFDTDVFGLKVEEGLIHPISVQLTPWDRFTCSPYSLENRY